MNRAALRSKQLVATVTILMAGNGFAQSGYGGGNSSGDDCRREFLTPGGYAESHLAPYCDSALTGPLCTVAVTQSTGPNASAYIFEPGGIFHVANLNGPGIHSFAVMSPASARNELQPSTASYTVHADGLSWGFSKQNYSLQNVQETSTRKDCLTPAASESSVPIVTGENFDLEACASTVMIDLGSSDTRQTAALKRDREASVKADINGSVKSCQVKIGTLFNYQLNALQKPKQTVIVEPGNNPCVMYASKEFPQLPPNQSLPAFYARHPDHFCRTMAHANIDSFRLPPKPIASGTTPLRGDQDISYHLKDMGEVERAVHSGRGKDCGLIAQRLPKRLRLQESIQSQMQVCELRQQAPPARIKKVYLSKLTAKSQCRRKPAAKAESCVRVACGSWRLLREPSDLSQPKPRSSFRWDARRLPH